MCRMKSPLVSLALVLLISWSHQPVACDEQTDVGHDEDVHPNTLTETNRDVFDMDIDASRYVPDTNTDISKDNYDNAEFRPPSSFAETQLFPDTPSTIPRISADLENSQALNRTSSTSSTECGEYRSHLTSNGQCRLMATLPPVQAGATQKRCPDMFRCKDDISHWLHENQNRKDQLDVLSETMSELQEELRNHRHRVKVLEMQGEESVSINSIFDRRLRSLEPRHGEADTLLHVHASLLFDLRAQLRNLSAAVQQMSNDTGCINKAIKTRPLLSMRDTRLPDGRYLSFCQSDCASLSHSGVRRSGVYNIVASPGTILPVYCDMETEGGGWTVFQRRSGGSVSFNQGWSEYRVGFGDPRGEHWLGNQPLHLLTNHGLYSLRIDLQDWSHTHRHALYNTFRIENEVNQFRLHVSGFSGTVGDSFGWYHDSRGFSTPDTGNICAEISHSGWWFNQCFQANLNGVYYRGGRYSLKAQNLLGPDGIVWFSWKESDFYSLKAVTMMLRPRNYRPRLSP